MGVGLVILVLEEMEDGLPCDIYMVVTRSLILLILLPFLGETCMYQYLLRGDVALYDLGADLTCRTIFFGVGCLVFWEIRIYDGGQFVRFCVGFVVWVLEEAGDDGGGVDIYIQQ